MAFLFPPTKYSPRRVRVKFEPTLTHEEKKNIETQTKQDALSLSWPIVAAIVVGAIILSSGVLYFLGKSTDKKPVETKTQLPDYKLSL